LAFIEPLSRLCSDLVAALRPPAALMGWKRFNAMVRGVVAGSR